MSANENIDARIAGLRSAAAVADDVARAAASGAAAARKAADVARAEAVDALEDAMTVAAQQVSPNAVVSTDVVYSGPADPDSVCPEVQFSVDGWRLRLCLERGVAIEFASFPTVVELRLAFQLLWPNGSGLTK